MGAQPALALRPILSMTPDPNDLAKPGADPSLWLLDPALAFLNHGSFGSCPRALLGYQQALRDRMERRPIQFLVRELEALLDAARDSVGQFVGASPDDLVFVPNATAGVNTVLRSLTFAPNDELIVTDHEYNACRNALNFVAERSGARVVVVPVPFPVAHEDEIIGPLLQAVTPRTRLVLADHVTSQTGLVLPIQLLANALTARGVDLLVDGAHAPGMIPLHLAELGAAYYTGNCHKWLCAPKGTAILYVRRDRQSEIRPLSISHGANSPRKDRSRFLIEFSWTGTADVTGFLTIPEAIRWMSSLLPGGLTEVMARNRRLALRARQIICEALGINLPCPDSMIGSLASIPIAASTDSTPPSSPLYADPLQDWLRDQHAIEVPVIPWPAPPRRLLRISAQLYNSLPQYQQLAIALREAGV